MKTVLKSPLLTPIAFSVIALLFLAVGVTQYAHTELFFSQAQQAPGTLAAYEYQVRSDGRSTYCPRFEFTTPGGQEQTTYGDGWEACSTQPDGSQIGTSVIIYYDPSDPSAGRLRHSAGDEAGGLILGLLLFVAFMAAAVVSVLRHRRQAAALARRSAAQSGGHAERRSAVNQPSREQKY